MADPYWRYSSTTTDRESRTAFAGYYPPNSSSNASQQPWAISDPRGTSDFLRHDVSSLQPGCYITDDVTGNGSYSALGHNGAAAGMRTFTPLEDPALLGKDILGVKSVTTDVKLTSPLVRADGPSTTESNILFVDGLPPDCTRREVAHLFRPFIGFEDIKVVHKEPRRTDDKAYVLCFVEFKDSKCALTAMEALQGYRFDDKKTDAPVLRIQFAKFPFRPTSVIAVRRP